MLTQDELFFLYLNNTSKMYPRRFNDVYFTFGNGKDYTEYVKKGKATYLTEDEKEDILSGKWKEKVRDILSYADKISVHTVFCSDDLYPEKLKNLSKPPALLYCIGDLSLLDTPSVAVVGSRRASNYGAEVTECFVREFASSEITVVSGMAEGIDACAHRSAINHGGKTVAVLGCGVDRIYPTINEDIYSKLCLCGLVVSEYPLSSKPQRGNFPERNRLIIGLSDCLLVAEAGEKSGTMITVDHALEQGKTVYAVPGSIFSYSGKGVNRLIKSGCAVATEPADVLEEFGIYVEKKKEENKVNLSGLDKKIYGMLKNEDCPFHILMEKLACDPSELTESLMMLEISGIIVQYPGRIYSLKR